MTSHYGFFFNSSSCSGCRACQIACQDKNNLEPNRLWRQVIEVTGGDWTGRADTWHPGVFSYNISMACNHCEEPICMKVCPTKSISKREDGIVLINPDTCAGCHYCEWACPYEAPRYNITGRHMTKCNLCVDRIDAGLAPTCVSVCGLRALEFGEIDAFREKQVETDSIYPLPAESLTRPSIVIKPHKDASKARKEPSEVANREEMI